MKALVTGATGFIGSSLVRELLKDGAQVRVFVRRSSDTRNINGLDVGKAYGDIRDGESVKSALKGCDALYHLAACTGSPTTGSNAFYDINVEGTRTTLNAALEQGLETVVYTSSIAALGVHGPDGLANEESEFNLCNTGEHYSRSKYLGEVEAANAIRRGLPLVIVSPSMAIGARDTRPSLAGRFIVSALKRRIHVYIDGGVNLVDVEDVARGHILAAQKGRIGERYILGNQNVSKRDFLKLIDEVSGAKRLKLRVPYVGAITLGYAFQFAASISRRPAVMTSGNIRWAAKYRYCDASKAVNELGLRQTPIKTSIEKAVNWFRENGYVKGT